MYSFYCYFYGSSIDSGIPKDSHTLSSFNWTLSFLAFLSLGRSASFFGLSFRFVLTDLFLLSRVMVEEKVVMHE